VTVPYDAWVPEAPQLRIPGAPPYAHYYDLDELMLPYVQRFSVIVTRISPVASRPPASYRLAFRGRYYEVWERNAELPTPADHLPLGGADSAVAKPRCADVRAIARIARSRKERLVAFERRPLLALDVREMQRPRRWKLNYSRSVVPFGQGRVHTRFSLPQGTYSVWVRGSFGRGAFVSVDERRVGRVRDVQTPGQMSLERRPRSLAPGNGRDEFYDTVFLSPEGGGRLITAPPDRFRFLCRSELDWIERVP
jgi:hypothetical protein